MGRSSISFTFGCGIEVFCFLENMLKVEKNIKKQQKVLYVLYKCVHLRTHNKLIHTLIKVFRFKVMQVLREKGLHFLLYGSDDVLALCRFGEVDDLFFCVV